jgi:hypothetical protein
MTISAYSIARPDRSGSKVNEDLFVYAHCLKMGYNYLGPIGTNWLEDHTRLCAFLNLPLPLKNPPPDGSSLKIVEDDYSRKIYPDVNHLITNDFLGKIRSQAEVNILSPEKFENPKISIHIRRGDVSLHTHTSRYITNQYFLDSCKMILQRFPNSEINIFSESDSSESFDQFLQIGCRLKLDIDLAETWKQIINSDVFFMSKSSFSYVPALYNRNLIVYYPAWYQKLDHWLDSMDEFLWDKIYGFLEKKYGK